MNFKILVLIGVVISIAAILAVNQSITRPEIPQEGSQPITKENISTGNNSSTLPQNATSLELLSYCSKDESHIYDDTCIRGLWQVADNCKDANFSSNNPICNDSRFETFEMKVTNEMHDLDMSLNSTVDSCMTSENNSDIQSCLVTIERIKSDCTDSHFYTLTNICKDPRLGEYESEHKDVLSNIG